MKLRINGFALAALATPAPLTGQRLSPKWEELTAEDFVKALDEAQDTCTRLL